MGRPRLKSKVKETRESKYYGIPIRIKPKLVDRVKSLAGNKKAFNTQLDDLLGELMNLRDNKKLQKEKYNIVKREVQEKYAV